MCGMVSQYNEAEFPPGPNLGFVVGKRVTIQGFIVSDKPEKLAEWRQLAAPWVADGSLVYREDVHEGLESGARRVGRHPGRAQLRQDAGAGRSGSRLMARADQPASPSREGEGKAVGLAAIRHVGGGIWAVGVDLEIASSSSVMSAGTSANSGVLR